MQKRIRSVLFVVAVTAVLSSFTGYLQNQYRIGDRDTCLWIAGMFSICVFVAPVFANWLASLLAKKLGRSASLITGLALVVGITTAFLCGYLASAFIYRIAD